MIRYTEREALNKLLTEGIKDYSEEGSASSENVDSEVVVVTIDVSRGRTLGIGVKNTGANSIDYSIVGYVNSSGEISGTIQAYTSVASGSSDINSFDVSAYSVVKVLAKATTSGSPSDIKVEYIVKA